MNTTENEVWIQFCCTIGCKKVLLEVSNYGRRKTTNIKTGKIIKLDYGADNHGYKKFGSFGYAHRNIALAFIENPECKPEVNHIDGCKSNNHISNLEWVTPSENVQHAFDTGLNSSKGKKLSVEHKAKLSKVNKGKKLSAETRAKMSAVFKGRKHSAKTKAKLSEAKKDNNIYQFWNVNTGEMVLGKYSHLQDTSEIKFGISKASVQRLKLDPNKVIKGWRCLGSV